MDKTKDLIDAPSKLSWDKLGGELHYCTGLTDFDLTSFNTTNIRNMSAFFAHCQNLSSVKVSASWNTSNANVTDMFIDCGIDHVTQIN